MKSRHIFENRVYLISNRAVAGNPIFLSKMDQLEFLEKVEQYLKPICVVHAYSLHSDQFQLLIETKSRRSFTKFFRNMHKGKTNEKIFLPLSTHIFSRQMSNLQVSVAKKFNFRNDRSGALFAGRFERILIEDENELDMWIDKLNGKVRFFDQAKKWASQMSRKDGLKLECLFSSCFVSQEDGGGEERVAAHQTVMRSDLGACFQGKLKHDHLPPDLGTLMLDFRKRCPCGPNYN